MARTNTLPPSAGASIGRPARLDSTHRKQYLAFQHRPERCFTVYGLRYSNRSRGWQRKISNALAHFRKRKRSRPVLGCLLAPVGRSHHHRDYAARIWDDLAPQPETWVLVTVLFDTLVDLQSQPVKDLATACAGWFKRT
jgi:hypothetical protein